MDLETKEGAQVFFNQAQWQMFRIHEIMKEINLCWTNLTGITNGIPNYQILFDNLCSYYLEISSTFTPNEVEAIDNIITELETKLNQPIWNFSINSGIGGQVKDFSLNTEQYIEIKKGLRNFQKSLLETAHKHGLLNPAKADPRLAVIT